MTAENRLTDAGRGSGPYIAPLLAHDEAGVIESALYAYLSETQHYLRGSGFTPCAPDCAHCRPKVEHFAEVKRGLERREDAVSRAIAVMLAARTKATDDVSGQTS